MGIAHDMVVAMATAGMVVRIVKVEAVDPELIRIMDMLEDGSRHVATEAALPWGYHMDMDISVNVFSY